MKFAGILITFIVAIFGFSIYLYLQNKSLEYEIAKVDQACSREMAEIKQRYDASLNEQLSALPSPQETNTTNANSTDNPRLDNMSSYGQRVHAVRQKYEFLLKTVKMTEADKKRLDQLLVEREKINEMTKLVDLDPANTYFEDLTYKLASIEEYIKDLLNDPIDFRRYNYLKERSL